MRNQTKLNVSHAPFWHDGGSICTRSVHIMLAALIAIIPGLMRYGMPAVGVISLSVSSAIFWEILMNLAMKRPIATEDGNAAVIGLIFGMLLPATMPWWAVITGTFVAIVIGKQIYGGIGGNPFNPTVIGVAILMVAWKSHFDFDEALLNYEFNFTMLYPIAALKNFGVSVLKNYNTTDLLMGNQIGGIGSSCGIALIIGGAYLMLRGFIRWEISLSFIAGVIITAYLFNLSNPEHYAGPVFHLLTGYTLIGIFFLATEDSSSPVNFIPMLIYGLGCGILTILIRNIGQYADGVILAVLLMNLVNPLVDKIRPKALGKV
ncbi:MAG: RnfABCDGE type electron transport complex subunit D [Proteobacteria bacterium]|nr:RnfABCDGE type electron transport complex subunit D [Pseudomonadota bacterium]